MSTILKALKKLEEEKSRRQEGGVDLARDILLGEAQRQRPSLWPFVVGGSVLLSIIAGAIYLVLRVGPPPPVTSAPIQPAITPEHMRTQTSAADEARVETVQIVPVVLSPPSPAVQSPPGRNLPDQPVPVAGVSAQATPSVEQKPSNMTAVVPAVERPAPAKPAARGDDASLKLEPAVAGPALGADRGATAAGVARGEPAAPLVVSGIAFQEQREARMAIVNGLPVMEGSNMEGARVVEILADRVRFSQDDRTFEVSLDAGRP